MNQSCQYIQHSARKTITSHELQNVNILRQIRVTKMSPQMLSMLRSTANEHQYFDEKHISKKYLAKFRLN